MKLILSICCLILFSVAANADLPRPKPPEQPAKVLLRTSFEIVPETNGFQARLQLSQSDLQALRAALDNAPGSPAVVGGISLSPGRTIIAGLMLFMAIAFTGLLLARSKRGRVQKTRRGVDPGCGRGGRGDDDHARQRRSAAGILDLEELVEEPLRESPNVGFAVYRGRS